MSVRLEPPRVIATAEVLHRRIEERFPSSSLSEVCGRLVEVARESETRARGIARPIIGLRIGIGVLVALLLGGIVLTLMSVEIPTEPVGFADLVTLLEAGLNDLVFVGIAIAFLVTLETRIKRHRALDAVRDLRDLAHIIDMHQLTKDPASRPAQNTASSPNRQLVGYPLLRYLSYCTEMLALLGKIGAFYVQDFDDEVVLVAVNEIEVLSTGLSRKIWQKIVILEDPVPPA